MKQHDVYKHFNGTLYKYVGVAIGKRSQFDYVCNQREMKLIGTARHHDTLRDLNIYEYNNIRFIDSLDAHVIYYNAEQNITWARPVDDFFGYKVQKDGQSVKRFMLLSKKTEFINHEKGIE